MRFTAVLTLVLCTYQLNAQNIVKKVLFEEYTGAWCQWCGEGTYMAEEVGKTLPGKMITVANHVGDDLQTVDGYTIANEFQIGSFPSATIDRYRLPGDQYFHFNRIDWILYVNQRANTSAIASVSFNNCSITASGNYDFDVNVVFKTAPEDGVPLSISVLVLEDSIAAVGSLAQANSSAIVQPGVDPMLNWFHNNTLRATLSGTWGVNPFPAKPVLGTTYKRHFSFIKPASWVAKQIRLVAFVSYNGVTSSNEREVLNSEQIALRSFTKASKIETGPVASIQSIGPNPAKTHDVVRLQYHAENTEPVCLQLLNSLGQLLAIPYNGYDAAGIHTISFSAAEYALNPGVYFLKLASASGSNVRRLVVE
jgi:hypothetical protein